MREAHIVPPGFSYWRSVSSKVVNSCTDVSVNECCKVAFDQVAMLICSGSLFIWDYEPVFQCILGTKPYGTE